MVFQRNLRYGLKFISTYLSGHLIFSVVWKRRCFIAIAFQTFIYNSPLRKFTKIKRARNWKKLFKIWSILIMKIKPKFYSKKEDKKGDYSGLAVYWNYVFGFGHAVAQLGSWLRHCATSHKVVGSIPDGIIVSFHWRNPSGRTMAMGSTQPLTKMSARNISCGVKAAGV